jgi:hypothetical protein
MVSPRAGLPALLGASIGGSRPDVAIQKGETVQLEQASMENIDFDKPPVYGVRPQKNLVELIDSKSFGTIPQPSVGNFNSINDLED